MKHRFLCSVLLALIASSALAAAPAPAPAPAKQAPVDPLAGAVPDAQSPDAQNPLTGRNLSVERLEKELEVQKKATALLEERLRQHGIRLDAQNLATKKDAEMSSFRTQIARERGERGAAAEHVAAPVAPVAAEAPAKTKAKKAKPVAKPAPQPVAEPVATEPALPRFEVVGVSGGASGASVVLSTSAGTAAYRDGETSPWGKVSIDTAKGTARIGGQIMSLTENAIARRQFSDPRAAKVGSMPAGAIPAGGSASARQGTGIGIPVPPRP